MSSSSHFILGSYAETAVDIQTHHGYTAMNSDCPQEGLLL